MSKFNCRSLFVLINTFHHTHTHTHSLSLTLTHSHTLTLTLTHTQTHTHTHIHTHSHIHSLSLSLSLSHTLTHSHTRTHIQGVPGGNANILGVYSTGQSKQKCIHVFYVSMYPIPNGFRDGGISLYGSLDLAPNIVLHFRHTASCEIFVYGVG